ncbi:alpha/beta fold hydrolase [Rhabdothermincola salaria]|uniref:alpha/beta fold hydrolase n=1 Tax=Rhabdothermincola salaria TaxID=2903142 RepID=UPI001E3BAB2C|nr:lipase family protein [Rhabdothermincola salaria]
MARLLGAAVALTLVMGACSSDDDDATTTTDDPGTTAAATTPSTLAPPDGLPAFYGVPDPLPAGEPGDLIAAERLEVPEIDGTTWRVMYHSESTRGDDIAVTGMVMAPEGPAPDGGWPIISWAHGTTGIADQCAPSLEPADLAVLANPLLERGYVVTATDYEGMGTPGRHPYIAGESEARGTIDIVRAAEDLDADLDLSDRYLVWGHSQGGHAAMFTLEIGEQWAPELEQVGVVAGAPPSQLLLINAALQTSPFRYYIAMAAAGLNAAYGDEAAPLDEVLTPEGLEFLDNVDEGCTAELREAAAGIEDFAALQLADPADVPAWNELLVANDPGSFDTARDAPLLIIQGGEDEQIPVASSALLFDQLCEIGQVVQRWVYPGQSHAGVVLPSSGDMLRWIDDRFAGEPAPDPYQPVGPPVPETQSCPPV